MASETEITLVILLDFVEVNVDNSAPSFNASHHVAFAVTEAAYRWSLFLKRALPHGHWLELFLLNFKQIPDMDEPFGVSSNKKRVGPAHKMNRLEYIWLADLEYFVAIHSEELDAAVPAAGH